MKNKKEYAKKEKFFKENVLIYSLIISPVLFYLYLIFPDKPATEFVGIKITSYFLESVSYMFWVFFIKAHLILLLSLWFFYNKEWWRYAILPILCYTIFQLASSINEDFNLSPIFEHYYFLFFFLVFIPIYLLLDKVINYSPLALNDKIEGLTNDTLTKLIEFDKKTYLKLKKEFEHLQLQKDTLTQKEYLYKLMAIQTSIDTITKT